MLNFLLTNSLTIVIDQSFKYYIYTFESPCTLAKTSTFLCFMITQVRFIDLLSPPNGILEIQTSSKQHLEVNTGGFCLLCLVHHYDGATFRET